MATDRQIEANRKNAARSTGPTSQAGKDRSRLNASKHGMAGESPALEATRSDAFVDRRAKWGREYLPEGEAAHWAIDRAVAASFRIERCEQAIDDLRESSQARATLAWDQDRAVEAATTFARLAKDPILATRQLQASLAGVKLLVEAWLGLLGILAAGRDWSEAEASKALDLLGVSPDLRGGRTPIDLFDATANPIKFHQELARGEVAHLEALAEESLIPLDDLDRRNAISGHIALLSKPSKLVLRYERDAWRRYDEAIEELKAPAQEEVPQAPAARPAQGPVARKPETRAAALDRLMAAPVRPMGSARPDGTNPIEARRDRSSEAFVVGKTREGAGLLAANGPR